MSTPLGSQTWDLAKDIVAAALALPESERSGYVDSRCDRHSPLGEEVLSLLAQASGIENYIESGAALSTSIGSAPSSKGRNLSGERIGAYVLTEPIGEGGMGVVYAAKRADGAYEQTVAVKLLRLGSQSARDALGLARERQSLALLSHPNIARLIDGGETADGTPYIVMELVEGLSIDRYCQDRSLSLRKRVELVRGVCDAVQSAHQRLLIHRDIKPSNILVTESGQPKLLDFGIARLLESSDGHATSATQMQFSPRYASPEQVRGQPVTVATDVYGLGLLLFELLAGNSPYERISSGNTASAMDAMQAILQDTTRSASEVARARSAADAKELQGDLDTILAKACAREPSERYPTVAALNEDLNRWLEGRPILARPQTRAYRLQKFLSRHRWPALAAACAGTIVAVSSVNAVMEKRRADASLTELRKVANALIFDLYEKIETLPGSSEARKEVLERGTRLLDSQLAAAARDHDLAAELAVGYRRLGHTYFNGLAQPHVGDRAKADAARDKGRALAQTVLEQSPNHVEAMLALGRIERDIAALRSFDGKHAEAKELNGSAVARYERALALRPDDADTRFMVAMFYVNQVDINLAAKESPLEPLERAKFHGAKWAEGRKDDKDYANLMATLLRKERRVVGEWQKDIPRAVSLADQEVALLENELQRYPNNHTYTRNINIALHNVASLLIESDPAAALPRFDKAIAHSEKLVAIDPADSQVAGGLAGAFTRRGRAHEKLGQREQARADYRESIRRWDELEKKELLPYMRRQQAEAIWRLLKVSQATKESVEAKRLALRLAALAKQRPETFAQAPAATWLNDAREALK